MTGTEYPAETPPPPLAGKVNPHYTKVDAVLREQPGVWRKVVAVRHRRDAQRWRQAGQRKGWIVKQRRSDDGWDVYAMVNEETAR
jgi:hypothetical protein